MLVQGAGRSPFTRTPRGVDTHRKIQRSVKKRPQSLIHAVRKTTFTMVSVALSRACQAIPGRHPGIDHKGGIVITRRCSTMPVCPTSSNYEPLLPQKRAPQRRGSEVVHEPPCSLVSFLCPPFIRGMISLIAKFGDSIGGCIIKPTAPASQTCQPEMARRSHEPNLQSLGRDRGTWTH